MKEFFKSNRRETGIFLYFVTFSLLIVVFHFLFHPVRVLGMDTSIFYLDEKHTLASFLTMATSFLVGFLVLTGASSFEKIQDKIVEIVYGLFFLILAFDEYFETHEYANTMIKAWLGDEGVFAVLSVRSWIFPLISVVVLVFLLLFIKIYRSERKIKRVLVAGSICFLMVLILEIVEGSYYGDNIYLYLVGVEEGLEMIGVSFFLYGSLLQAKQMSRKNLSREAI